MKHKSRVVTYSLYEIVFAINTIDKAVLLKYDPVFEWLTPTEFAAIKRSHRWKKYKISCKKLSTITIKLSL